MHVDTFSGNSGGDPHILTLDGLLYTFNGFGEYILIDTENFILQGRTIQAQNIDGDLINATIWGAFAMQGKMDLLAVVNGSVVTQTTTTRLHVELKSNLKG